jgi:hypothetical protein
MKRKTMANALTFKIGADTANLQSSLKKAQSAVAAIKPAMAGLAVAGAAAMSALAVAAAGVKKALDLGGQLSDVASQTGLTAGKVMLLKTAFDQAGIGAGQVGETINRMQRFLAQAATGTGPAAEALQRLGLSAKELTGISPDQALRTIGAAVSNIKNPTERAAAAMDIFGRSGGKLLGLFGDAGALATAADTLGAQAAIMDRNAGVFDRVSDLINSASAKLQGIFVGLAEPLAAVVLPLFERLNKLDFTGLGQRLGNVASMFIQAMTDGSIWSVMADSLQIAMGKAANFLVRSQAGFISYMVAGFQQIPQNLIAGLGILTKPNFWKGMLSAFIGIASAFGSKFLAIIAQALELFSKIPGIGNKLKGPMEAVQNAALSLTDIASQKLTEGGDTLSPFLAQIRERAGANLTALREGYQKGFDGMGDIFDLSGIQENLDGTFARLGNTVESLKTQAQAALPAPNSPGGLTAAFGAIDERAGTGPTQGGATNQPLFASSLAKIGGGGGVAGASAMLDESRRQTRILLRIADGFRNFNTTPMLA